MDIESKFKMYGKKLLNELYFSNIDEKDFYENESVLNKEIVRTLLGVCIDNNCSYKDNIVIIRDCFEMDNININNFYYQAYNGFLRLFYVYNGFIMDIGVSSSIKSVVENIKDVEDEFDDYFINGNELSPFLFMRATNLFRPQMIEFLGDYMKEDDLIKEIRAYQKSNDYNANNFSLELIEKAYNGTADTLNDFIDEDGYIVLYRGVGSKSTELECAYSWTLNEDVAKFFATRAVGMETDIDDIKVYKAFVHKKYILGAIVDSEEEVIVNPNGMEDTILMELNFDKTVHYQMPKERQFLTDKYLPKKEADKIISTDTGNGDIKISPILLKMFGNK